jgi:hypothetical protein
MVNTTVREGLPNSFLEELAHQCAILSAVDPDKFASRFGYRVADGDFERGLEHLLANNRWRSCGLAGYQHVKQIFAADVSMERHEAAYRSLIGSCGC